MARTWTTPWHTLAEAMEEALMGWIAEQAGLEHASEPFTDTEIRTQLRS